MHFDAAIVFLDCEDVGDALGAANQALSSIKDAETCAFELMEKLKGVNMPSKVPYLSLSFGDYSTNLRR